MKDELDRKLCERYPKIFADRHGDMKTTAMCWGFECGDGWFNIIDKLCWNIQDYIDCSNEQRERLLNHNPYNVSVHEEIPQVVATQVKEKFGTLRFYYSGGNDYITGMFRMAESMSSVICEVCGSSGKSRGHSWYYTACDEHTNKVDLIISDDEELT
jgi:hypothetical protein